MTGGSAELGTSKGRLWLVAGAAVAARGVSILSTIVLVPIVLHHYGTGGFAIWTVFSVAMSLLVPLDFGLGLGLVVSLSSEPDRARWRGLISTAFSMLLLSGLAFVAFWALSEAVGVNWIQLLGLPAHDFSRATRTVIVGAAVAGIALALPTQVPARIHLALGEGHVGSAFTMAAQIVSTVAGATWALSHGSFPGFCCIVFIGPTLGGAVNLLFLRARRSGYLPGLHWLDKPARRPLINVALMFFLINIASAVSVQSDSLIVSQALGAEMVARFSLYSRLFLFPSVFIAFAGQTLVSEFSRLIAARARTQVLALFRKVLLLSTVAGIVLSGFLAFTAPTIIRVWTGRPFPVDHGALAAFAIWGVMFCAGPVFGTFVNAARAVRYQITVTTLMAVSNVIVSLVLVRTIGFIGPAIGTITSTLVFWMLPTAWWLRTRFLVGEEPSGAHAAPGTPTPAL